MSRKLFVFTGVLTVLSLLLAACGGQATSAPSTPEAVEVTRIVQGETITEIVTATPPPPEEVNLKIWIMPNGPDPLAAIQTEIDAYQVLNPNVHIEAEVLDWGSAWTKITTAATSGEGPDISQLGTTWVAAIAAMGALRPFTAEEIASMGGADNFVAASWQTCNPVGSGFTVAVPWFVDTRALIYRKDVLEQVGLEPDTAFADWNSFDAALATIEDADVGLVPIGFPGKNDWNVLHNFAPWVWGAGGEMLNPGNTAAAFNSPEAVEGFTFYASLFTKGYTPPDVLELNSAQVDGLFPSGEVAMIISGPWMVKNSRTPEDESGFAGTDAAENFAVHEIPAGPAGRYTFVGGSDLTVWNSSQHQEQAVDFVRYLAGKESQIRYGGNIGMLPAANEALADPAFEGDPDYGVFVQAVQNGKSYPAIAAWGPLETAMVKNLGALWDDVAGVNGPFDPDTMVPARLDAAKQEVDALLAAGGS